MNTEETEKTDGARPSPAGAPRAAGPVPGAWIAAALDRRLASGGPGGPAGVEFLSRARGEIAAGCDDVRFAGLVSLASRFVPAVPLAPSAAELAECQGSLPGWNPERWTLRETARIELVLARARRGEGLPGAGLAEALESAFQYADLGELCALYKSLAALPEPKRFAARAAEGARSNMRAVFESAVTDTPLPARVFDAVAWRQCVIKALFVEAPVWRIHGLDGRLDAELARMALDLAEERHSAGRFVNPQLWMVLGPHGGERAWKALEAELAGSFETGRAAAALALGRLDAAFASRARAAERAASEKSPVVAEALRRAARGGVTQLDFRPFDGPVPKVV